MFGSPMDERFLVRPSARLVNSNFGIQSTENRIVIDIT